MKIVEIVSRQIPYARTGAVDSVVVAIGRQIEIEKAGENRQMAEEWIVEMGAMGVSPAPGRFIRAIGAGQRLYRDVMRLLRPQHAILDGRRAGVIAKRGSRTAAQR